MHHSTVADLFIFSIIYLTLNLQTCFSQINWESTLKREIQRKLSKDLPNQRRQRTCPKKLQLLLNTRTYKNSPENKSIQSLTRTLLKQFILHHSVSSRQLVRGHACFLSNCCLHYVYRQHDKLIYSSKTKAVHTYDQICTHQIIESKDKGHVKTRQVYEFTDRSFKILTKF